ncbi:oligosaccharide flippase family protein [Streptomyces sp. XM83C]|uniref:oligosaccharide flippase family protein n=1 Tax=Streptomyces sp. XM83C TaxID=2929781 RepID=UPI001FF71CE1|nr:oligosaccharide flippase family protein [Streptomyces sp. XM83C]MCK1818413.1 oligosaccharide flippase family protein [Streptomyces sp. XM83C]
MSARDEESGGPSGRGVLPVRPEHTARTAMTLGVAEILGKVSMLVLTVGAARMLGVVDFGAFSYALAIGTLAAVVPQWGYDITVIQRASARPDRLRALLAGLLAMRTLLIVLVFAVIAGLWGRTSLSGDQGTAAGLLIVAAVLMDTYTEAYRAAAAALQRQRVLAVIHLVQRQLTAALALLALFGGTGLTGLAVAFCAGTVVGPLLAALLMRRTGFAPDWRAVSRARLVELNRGTWVIGVASLVLMVLFRVDTLMIAWFAGDREVGIYAAVYRLLETTLFVSFVTARTVFPLMAADPDPARVRRFTEQGVSMMAVVFAPYAVVLWCRGHTVLGRVLRGFGGSGRSPVCGGGRGRGAAGAAGPVAARGGRRVPGGPGRGARGGPSPAGRLGGAGGGRHGRHGPAGARAARGGLGGRCGPGPACAPGAVGAGRRGRRPAVAAVGQGGPPG